MSKLCIGIICGGCSAEHYVSLKSARNIVRSINKNCFEVIVLWIDKKGCWYLINNVELLNAMSSLQTSKCTAIFLRFFSNQLILYSNNIDYELKIDIIFPIIHGTLGEDGTLQGLLRMMNIPFIGSDVLGSAISMDKDVSKRLLRDAGLLVAPYKIFLINEKDDINFNDVVSILGLPLFIKPVNQGSSIGVSKVINNRDFKKALITAFSFSHKILIESTIIGREIECAVLGNDDPEVSICGEIISCNNSFYTYTNKYLIPGNSQIVIPAQIDDTISNKIRCIALQAFQVLNCFGMARVDFFLTLDNQIIVNEVNTLPGFTENSMYPKLWEVTGLNFQKLIIRLIELAYDLHCRNQLNYVE